MSPMRGIDQMIAWLWQELTIASGNASPPKSSMPFHTIKEAIRTGHRIRLSLAEGEYLVEPHVLGRNKKGRTLLRAFKLRGPGPTAPWKVFDLERIQNAKEVPARFHTPRPGYNPDDPAMSGEIIERV